MQTALFSKCFENSSLFANFYNPNLGLLFKKQKAGRISWFLFKFLAKNNKLIFISFQKTINNWCKANLIMKRNKYRKIYLRHGGSFIDNETRWMRHIMMSECFGNTLKYLLELISSFDGFVQVKFFLSYRVDLISESSS